VAVVGGSRTERPSLARFAWLSIGAALATMALKSLAFLLTGSVGLLSDAIESSVNLVAAVVALVTLRIAARPADETHHWGHGKAEYFSAGVEGLMIFGAAAAVIATAVPRLLHPQPLESVGVGLAVSAVAGVANLAVARVLLRAGDAHRSITLSADGKHLMTDVWTSVGVIVGVGLVALTGWQRLDPLVAVLVGANILVAGSALIRNSTSGLMDAALPTADLAVVEAVLARHRTEGQVAFHAVRTRAAGQHRFVLFHLLVPGDWTVHEGHELAERIEAEICAALPGSSVTAHIEPIEDAASYADIALAFDRWDSGAPTEPPGAPA
jgi:cation diffusion facilitator family transporter